MPSVLPTTWRAATAPSRMITPGLEFVYEATGDLEPPRAIGKTYDGTRRIIPIIGGVTLAYFAAAWLMRTTIMTEKLARRGVHVPHALSSTVT